MTVAYVDSSALVKLVVPEAESEALERTLRSFARLVSSELTSIEVLRAGRRVRGRPGLVLARTALELLALQPIDRSVIEGATTMDPAGLRSLDAIHLASALTPSVAPTLVAYDTRLLAAARAHGLATLSPGREV